MQPKDFPMRALYTKNSLQPVTPRPSLGRGVVTRGSWVPCHFPCPVAIHLKPHANAAVWVDPQRAYVLRSNIAT